MGWDVVRAWLAGLFGLALLLGLLFVGFAAALVVVPVGVIAFLVLRHRIARRLRMMETTAFTWTGEGGARRSTDIEGVAIDVTVEVPGDASTESGRSTLDRPHAQP